MPFGLVAIPQVLGCRFVGCVAAINSLLGRGCGPGREGVKMRKRFTVKEVIEELNEIGCPDHDHPENGGRVSWAGVREYGKWLYRHDPIAFQLAKQDIEGR